MRHLPIAVLSLLACALLAEAEARACSSFVLGGRRAPVFGSNFDNTYRPGVVYIGRRGLAKTWIQPGTTGCTAAWTSHYGSVAISVGACQFAWAGMNEAGLTFSTMALSETACPAPDARPPLPAPIWMQYLLDTCERVRQIPAAAESLRAVGGVDHYLVCDRFGDWAVLQFLDGRVVLRTGTAAPLPVLTNTLYADAVEHWRSWSTQALDPHSAKARFARLAGRVPGCRVGRSRAAVDSAFQMLRDVSAGRYTRWSLVFDVRNRVMYFRTHDNPRERRIDLKKLDFTCDQPVLVLDPHADLSGDVTADFRPQDEEAALSLAVEANRDFKVGFTDEQLREVLRLFATFPCKPEPR